jgi:hypothetical protein
VFKTSLRVCHHHIVTEIVTSSLECYCFFIPREHSRRTYGFVEYTGLFFFQVACPHKVYIVQTVLVPRSAVVGAFPPLRIVAWFLGAGAVSLCCIVNKSDRITLTTVTVILSLLLIVIHNRMHTVKIMLDCVVINPSGLNSFTVCGPSRSSYFCKKSRRRLISNYNDTTILRSVVPPACNIGSMNAGERLQRCC